MKLATLLFLIAALAGCATSPADTAPAVPERVYTPVKEKCAVPDIPAWPVMPSTKLPATATEEQKWKALEEDNALTEAYARALRLILKSYKQQE